MAPRDLTGALLEYESVLKRGVEELGLSLLDTTGSEPNLLE